MVVVVAVVVAVVVVVVSGGRGDLLVVGEGYDLGEGDDAHRCGGGHLLPESKNPPPRDKRPQRPRAPEEGRCMPIHKPRTAQLPVSLLLGGGGGGVRRGIY